MERIEKPVASPSLGGGQCVQGRAKTRILAW
jgi:hypothetical protein